MAAAPTARMILSELHEYAAWANGRLLDLAEGLPEADVRRRFSEGALPILESFVHLASADRRWLARWKQESLPPGLTVADVPSVAAARRVFDEITAARRHYLAGIDDAALGAPISWHDGAETRTLARWQGIMQSANHGTQHRSEIAAMLTDCGQSPGDLDFGIWCRQARRY
jgi:uncharacterized damage-inducible protein DinB